MTEEFKQALPVLLTLIFITSLIFWRTWKFLGWCLVASLHIIKWSFVVLMLAAILNCGYTYRAFGWTPMSALFGSKIYEETLRENFNEKPNGEKISARTVRTR